MAKFSVSKKKAIVSLVLIGTPLVLWLLLSSGGETLEPELLPPEPAPTDATSVRDGRQLLASRYIDMSDFVEDVAETPRQRSWNCRVEDLPQFSVFSNNEHSVRLSGYASSLAASQNAEHVLAAAMLSDVFGKGAADDLLEAALVLDPTNPQVLWWAADLCTRQRPPDVCNDSMLQGRISSANRDNGAYWAMLANQQLRKGDQPGAIESLRRASTSAVLDYRFAQNVLLLERGLSAVGDLSFGQRFTMALAAAPLVGNHRELYNACRELITDDGELAQACLAFGHRAASESKTMIFKMIGYGIQRHVLGEAGDTDRLQAIIEAQDALRRDVNDYAEDWQLLMLADPRFIAQYADHFAVHGEVAAAQFAREEIKRLKALADYDPCALARAGDLPGNVQK